MSKASPPHHEFWLGKLANLNVARTSARGMAPHKPLMLLTIIDLFESGDLTEAWIHYDVRLVSRFRDYWELVQERQQNQPDIPMPFHALGSDQVWKCFTRDGQPSASKATTRLGSLNPDFFACLHDPAFRSQARLTLIAIYFTATEQVMLSARLQLSLPKNAAIDAFKANAIAFKASQKKGRDSRFKSDVLSAYYFTCALTGYRLDTESSSIVQAAHIHQHSLSGNNNPNNGLALTPDAHWMFDQGLWTLIYSGNTFVIRVASNKFRESSPFGRSLAACHNQPAHFHPDSRLRPNLEHLNWHRHKHLIS